MGGRHGGQRRGSVRRVDLIGVDEVPDGTMQIVWVDGTDPVLVVNVGGEIRAMQGICSHEYFELDKGFLTRDSLTCALHMSRFDLESGEALDPPAEEPLERLPGGRRGRPDRHRGPGRAAAVQRVGPAPTARPRRRVRQGRTKPAMKVLAGRGLAGSRAWLFGNGERQARFGGAHGLHARIRSPGANGRRHIRAPAVTVGCGRGSL